MIAGQPDPAQGKCAGTRRALRTRKWPTWGDVLTLETIKKHATLRNLTFAFAIVQTIWLVWFFYTGLGGAQELVAHVMSITLTLQILFAYQQDYFYKRLPPIANHLIVAATEYERVAIARAREEPLLAGRTVLVLAPEDVIVLKLIAGRAQDVADIEAILAAKPSLDEHHIEDWARFWGVLDTWRRLRDV